MAYNFVGLAAQAIRPRNVINSLSSIRVVLLTVAPLLQAGHCPYNTAPSGCSLCPACQAEAEELSWD